jgi:hypothetical protein
MRYIHIKNQLQEQEQVCPNCGLRRDPGFEYKKGSECRVLKFSCGSKTDFNWTNKDYWWLKTTEACEKIKELKDEINHLTNAIPTKAV